MEEANGLRLTQATQETGDCGTSIQRGVLKKKTYIYDATYNEPDGKDLRNVTVTLMKREKNYKEF